MSPACQLPIARSPAAVRDVDDAVLVDATPQVRVDALHDGLDDARRAAARTAPGSGRPPGAGARSAAGTGRPAVAGPAAGAGRRPVRCVGAVLGGRARSARRWLRRVALRRLARRWVAAGVAGCGRVGAGGRARRRVGLGGGCLRLGSASVAAAGRFGRGGRSAAGRRQPVRGRGRGRRSGSGRSASARWVCVDVGRRVPAIGRCPARRAAPARHGRRPGSWASRVGIGYGAGALGRDRRASAPSGCTGLRVLGVGASSGTSGICGRSRHLRIRRRAVRRRDRDVGAVRRLRDVSVGRRSAHPGRRPGGDGSVERRGSAPAPLGCGLAGVVGSGATPSGLGQPIGDAWHHCRPRRARRAITGRVVLGHRRGPSYCSREPVELPGTLRYPLYFRGRRGRHHVQCARRTSDGEAGSAHRDRRSARRHRQSLERAHRHEIVGRRQH